MLQRKVTGTSPSLCSPHTAVLGWLDNQPNPRLSTPDHARQEPVVVDEDDLDDIHSYSSDQ